MFLLFRPLLRMNLWPCTELRVWTAYADLDDGGTADTPAGLAAMEPSCCVLPAFSGFSGVA